MNRSRSISTLAAALAAAAAVPARAQVRIPVVVAPIASTDMAALYYGVQQHEFEKIGFDVTITATPSGAAAMVAVTGGAAQIGYSNTLALTTAHAKGIPLVLLSPGAIYNTNAPHAVLIAAADTTFKTAKDLEGRTVAVAGLHDLLGTSVLLWLEKNNVDATKVKFVEIPPPTMLAAMQSRRVDVAVSYEPFLSAATGSGAARFFAKPYDAIGNAFLTGAWFTSVQWAADHRDAAIRFARTLGAMSQYVDNHYDEMLPLISSFSKLPVETLQKMVRVVVPPNLTPAMLQPVIDVAAHMHEIPASFRAQELILAGVP